jgi:Concanavalin A-like lectin/glucanases superfamily/Bacterial Ig domain
LLFTKIFPIRNGKKFGCFVLLFCWAILFFSSSEVNSSFLNIASAQTGTYHYAPGLSLTGSNYQDVASSGSLQLSQFSVAAWFKTSTNFGGDAFIVNKGGAGSDSSGQNMNYGIWMTKTEKIQAGFESTSASDHFVTSAKSYNDNQWHYAVVTYGGSSVILYIDGVRVGTKSTTGASPETSGTKPVRVGANSRVTPPSNFFTGQVDEVRVWNDDLTTQRVADAFAGTSFNTAQQVLYLPFASNSPPVANNQAITLNKNTQQAITLSATDANNDPLTYTVVTQPTSGSLSGSAPNLTYNPNLDYVGPDSFTFKANDGTTDSNTATISITVQGPANDPPVANNQAVTTSKNIAKAITLTASDPNNDPLSYSIVTQPAHGTLTGTAPNLNYNPDTDYVGADSFTFKANDGIVDSNIATISITVIDPSKDQFGIIKLYPSKNNGEEWFINMDNPLSDSRFNPQNTITKNPDGSWKMKSTQVRMNVYTSTGYNSANIPTLDHSVIASKGYMLAPNDWRNFEMTQYVKVNTSPSDDNFAPYGRGGRHTGSGPPEGCEGSSIKGDVFFSGKVRFAKEQWHVSYVFTNIKTATGSIVDKWVGIKFIVYNFVENNKVVVKTELWLDINNNGNFVKVDENVDRGGWGTEGTACGGAPDQIISWGGPITTFRWDTATDVDFKNLSVREIMPPQ